MATILERMTDAGINEPRARDYLAKGYVRVDEERVTDPDRETAAHEAWTLSAPPD